jgi:hypothetical protein
LRSMHWTVANPRREGAASLSITGKNRRPTGAIGVDFRARPIEALRAHLAGATSDSGQGLCPIRRPTSLSCVRPQAVGPASSTLHAAAHTRPQSKRRIHSAALSNPPPHGSLCRRRTAWWKETGIDPSKVARMLWKKPRVNDRRFRPDRITQETISSRNQIA